MIETILKFILYLYLCYISIVILYTFYKWFKDNYKNLFKQLFKISIYIIWIWSIINWIQYLITW